MSDAKQPEKKANDTSALLASLNITDSHQTAAKLHNDAHERTHQPSAHHTEHINWRSELRHATSEMKKLDTLKADDTNSASKRTELIDSIDKHFQKALPLVHRNATSADSELLRSVANATAKDSELKNFQVNGKTMHLNSANMDSIHNAILNAPDEATRKQLTRFGALAESHKAAMHQVNESYGKTKAPMMAAMDYANFLLTHKDGISQNAKGEAVSAGDVLHKYMSREMVHSPRGKDLIKLAQDASINHQNALIPADKNPLALIEAAHKPGVTPQDAISKLTHAVELAKDPQFKTLVDQADQAAKQAQGPDAQSKLKAVADLKQAGTLSEGYLGQALLENGKSKEALTHLLNAGTDPDGAAKLTKDGKPSFAFALQAAGLSTEQTQLAYRKAMADVDVHTQLYKGYEQTGDFDAAVKEQKLASASADAAVQNAQIMKNSLGDGNGEKAEKEFNDLIDKAKKTALSADEKNTLTALQPLVEAQQSESIARLTRGNLELDLKNHNAATADLEAAQKLDPTFASDPQIKSTLDENLKKAQDGSVYDNKNWFEQRLSDAETAVGNAWDYAKDHPKVIAAAVALGVAAVAVGAVTGGLGGAAVLSLGEAAVFGGAVGTVGGTAVGASIEKLSGKNTFLGGVEDTVLPALGGAAAGVAMGAGLSLIGPTSELATSSPVSANAIRGALLGVPLSLKNAQENYVSGVDKNLVSAGLDFASQELSWAASGALMGKAGWVAKAVAPVAGIGLDLSVGKALNYYGNKLPLTSNYYKAVQAQKEADKQALIDAQTQVQQLQQAQQEQ